jgi:hypothetical protein
MWSRCGWMVRVSLVLVVVGIFALSGTEVSAKVCGGEIACACGDRVAGDAVLEEDLLGCRGNGLRLREDATLDCQGHAVTGSGSGWGITLNRTRGAEVRNCLVAEFATGIRLRGGSGNLVEANEVIGNTRYGIELAQRTVANRIYQNLVDDSGDEGVHVGSGADWNILMHNDIRDSGSENVYLLDAQHVFLIANNISSGGSAAIYMKHVVNSALILNSIEDRIVHVRGASHGNAFVVNFLKGAGYVFDAYNESSGRARVASGWSAPTGNRVIGGRVTGAKTCVRFSGASSNSVEGLVAEGCTSSRSTTKGGLAASGNSLSFS